MNRERAIEQLRARILRERRFEPKPSPPKERKRAKIHAFLTHTLIFSQAVYSSVHADPDGYDKRFPPEMPAAEIGREAREALQASRFITPDHPEWERLIRFGSDEEIRADVAREMAHARVRTQKALFEGSGSVSLTLQDGRISVDPWRYAGRGTWEPVPGIKPTILPESVSDEDLGAAINAALEVSRNA
ncbi:contact-dependent growth inhibition system immunity protein [Afifella sp. YEN Y35]|uniref:contact-dependent growth inhibition system immunity protein n=1 Tax=Afifella sp. YEN Y35 TaxID=3388337 RepID=UPI0039E08C28